MRVQSGSLGHDMLQTVGQPFIKGDHAGRFLVHGVKHLLPGLLFVLLRLVQLAVLGSESVGPGQSSGSVHQLGERFLADQTVIVGVSFGKHLQQAVVQLGVTVALLVSHRLLHPPDEVLLGLVERGHGGAGGRHRVVKMSLLLLRKGKVTDWSSQSTDGLINTKPRGWVS